MQDADTCTLGDGQEMRDYEIKEGQMEHLKYYRCKIYKGRERDLVTDKLKSIEFTLGHCLGTYLPNLVVGTLELR